MQSASGAAQCGIVSTFREDMLELANDIRRDVPGSLDLRQQHKLEIIIRTWNDGRPGTPGGSVDTAPGDATKTSLELVERYKVRQVTTREINESGGRLEEGDIRVGPITPTNGAGVGYTTSQLAPSTSSVSVEVIYKLSGPHQGYYRRVFLDSTSDVSWFLVLRRTARQPQVG